MSWEITWADMCRACMEVEGTLIPLFEDDNENSKNDLPSKLAELASIEIDKFDGLPAKLCQKCVYRTKSYFAFKRLVQESDEKLRNMFNEQLSEVISEVKDQIDDQIDCRYIMNEIELKEDCQSIKEDDANSSNEDKDNVTVTEYVPDAKVSDTTFIEDLEKVCDTVMLEAKEETKEETNEELNAENEIHIVFNTDEFNAVNNVVENEVIDQNDCETQAPISLCIEEELQNTQDLEVLINESNRQTSIDILQESMREIIEECNIPTDKLDHDESDSDSYVETQENIVGSLNDTITKVKEIKEGGQVVQYQCTLCLQNYKVLSEALSHIVDLHVPNTGPFYCVICEMDCDSIKQLKAHVKTHNGPNPYTCFLCNKSYLMKRYLKRHMACHTDFPRHRCAKCGVRFKVKSELETHIATHSQGAPFRCSQCPRVFNHKGNYKRHLISHLDPQGLHLPKYPCSVCNRRFLNNRTLITHMRVHTGEKPYTCETCSKSFSQQGNLLNHQKIHTNPRSFTCEVCGKSFNQKATLRDHGLLHSGEKPYVCTVCGMAFTFSAALRRHIWSHSDGKPFECDVCNAKFIGRYDLRRHMKIHNGKPKLKRSKSTKTKEENVTEGPEEIVNVAQDPSNSETIFVEQIFLCDNSIQIITQGDSEKENVDSLFGLIQYA